MDFFVVGEPITQLTLTVGVTVTKHNKGAG